MAQRDLEPPTPLHLLQITTVRFRASYTMAEVDEFLRRAHHALQSQDGSVTSTDVREVRFRPQHWKEGYHMGEVDDELDRIAAALERLEPPGTT